MKTIIVNKSLRIFPNYSEFSKIYDTIMGDRSGMANIVLHLVEKIFKKYNKIEMLDLACGTGEIHNFFDKRFKITGIDISEDMLRVARIKHPENKYIKSDVRRFTSEKAYDLITFNYDSINHLLQIEEWISMFETSYKNLKKGCIYF